MCVSSSPYLFLLSFYTLIYIVWLTVCVCVIIDEQDGVPSADYVLGRVQDAGGDVGDELKEPVDKLVACVFIFSSIYIPV